MADQDHDLLASIDLDTLHSFRFLPQERTEEDVETRIYEDANAPLGELDGQHGLAAAQLHEAYQRKRSYQEAVGSSSTAAGAEQEYIESGKRQRVEGDEAEAAYHQQQLADLQAHVADHLEDARLNPTLGQTSDVLAEQPVDEPSSLVDSTAAGHTQPENLAQPAIGYTSAELLEIPIAQLTPEQRKERTKEANRLAALKSRGKKRGEIAVLEQTVQAIQDENEKLRHKLEGLLAAAAHVPASAQSNLALSHPSIAAEQEMGNQPFSNPLDINSHRHGEEQVLRAVSDDQARERTQDEVDLGLDFNVLNSMRKEIEDLRNQIAEKRKQSSVSLSIPEASQAMKEEKTALFAHVKYLKEVRERRESDKRMLEREIKERRIMLDGRARLQQNLAISQLDANDNHAEASSSLEKGKGRESDPNQAASSTIEDGNASVGVERALLHLRGMLDGALITWRNTGIVDFMSGATNSIPIPLQFRYPPSSSYLSRSRRALPSTSTAEHSESTLYPHPEAHGSMHMPIDAEHQELHQTEQLAHADHGDTEDLSGNRTNVQEQDLQQILAMYGSGGLHGVAHEGVEGMITEGGPSETAFMDFLAREAETRHG